jgi:hypothetical protein
MTPEEQRALKEKTRELKRLAEQMLERQRESKPKVERALATLRELAGRR